MSSVGRPKEHRKRLVAYVKENTHQGITKLVNKATRLNTVGKVLDHKLKKIS